MKNYADYVYISTLSVRATDGNRPKSLLIARTGRYRDPVLGTNFLVISTVSPNRPLCHRHEKAEYFESSRFAPKALCTIDRMAIIFYAAEIGARGNLRRDRFCNDHENKSIWKGESRDSARRTSACILIRCQIGYFSSEKFCVHEKALITSQICKLYSRKLVLKFFKLMPLLRSPKQKALMFEAE